MSIDPNITRLHTSLYQLSCKSYVDSLSGWRKWFAPLVLLFTNTSRFQGYRHRADEQQKISHFENNQQALLRQLSLFATPTYEKGKHAPTAQATSLNRGAERLLNSYLDRVKLINEGPLERNKIAFKSAMIKELYQAIQQHNANKAPNLQIKLSVVKELVVMKIDSLWASKAHLGST